MTIAIALRTNVAIVLAADSKLTTRGIGGLDANGNPVWIEQTYDNATKIVQDLHGDAIAVVAGSVGLGSTSIMDYLATSAVPLSTDPANQNTQIETFAEDLANLRAAYWKQSKVPEKQWPSAVILLGVASPSSQEPMAWRILLHGEKPEVLQILQTPLLWLEGSYVNAWSLLYGFHPEVISAIGRELKVAGQAIGEDVIYQALQQLTALRPVDQLSLGVMPIQDAIELAVFLATTQVQMERFLPGNPRCGGPIDVVVLKTAPNKDILWFPGKQLRHPLGGNLG